MILVKSWLPFLKKAAKPLHFGAVLFFITIIAISSCSRKPVQVIEQTEGIAKYQYFGDSNMWQHIFESSPEFCIPDKIQPAAAIIPHHDITTIYQNSMYKAISQQINPKVIVVVAPDHFERGQKLITMPKDTVFMSPSGQLDIDYSLINQIASDSRISDVVSLQNDLWYEEHGIFIHCPFLDEYFPYAKVVPILVKMLPSDDEFDYFTQLGTVLNDVLPEEAFVIASVDFSHYQIPLMTSFHDSVSKNTVQNMEDPRFAEIDSPESVQTIMTYAKARGSKNPLLVHQSSTYDFIPNEFVESTSHQFWLFYDNQLDYNYCKRYFEKNTDQSYPQRYYLPENGKHQTVLIGGSGVTGAGIRETWKWDRYNTSTDEAEILLKKAAGKEARFFYGFDALIFDPPAGSVYNRSLHGTNLSVEVINKSDFDKQSKNLFGLLLLDSVDALQEIKKSLKILETPDVKILEVIFDNKNFEIDEAFVKENLLYYDVIVFRDNQGLTDAFAYLITDDGTLASYNLGVIHADGKIKGSLLAVDFTPKGKRIATFDYTSDDGIVPAIWQFLPED